MHQSLDMFQTAAAMARHAGSRQAAVARNVANADTPGYQAQHISSFQNVVEASGQGAMRVTRPGHISPDGRIAADAMNQQTTMEPSPNGNTVSIEEELLNSIAVSREHSRALAIYRHGMTVLRTTLGRS